MPEDKDKQVRPGPIEQKSLLHDVALPIAEATATGAGIGVATWATNKFGGGQKQPPPKKDN